MEDGTLVDAGLFLSDKTLELELEDEVDSLLLLLAEWVGCGDLLDHVVVLAYDYRDLVLLATHPVVRERGCEVF